MKKRFLTIVTALLMCMALPGCMLLSSPDDLYSLPKLPAEYTDLEDELMALVNSGFEYAPPASGENIQLVQMVDIDNDGEDEVLVFLRKNSDPKPMKIYVFKRGGEGYQTALVIQESAASIDHVEYRDLNGDGMPELIVGWRIVGADAAKNGEDGAAERPLTRILSVYNMERYAGQKLLEAAFNRYITTDLDGNGSAELTVISGGVTGNCDAAIYEWKEGALEPVYTVRLSVPPAMLEYVQTGGVSGGQQALFITGTADDQTLVTDILVYRDGTVVNSTMDEQTGISRLFYRDSGIRAKDIDLDGVLELPISVELPKRAASDTSYYAINWTAFDAGGAAHVIGATYHNLTDGWYLVLPESWKDTIMISGVTSSTGERAVTFGIWQGEGVEPIDVLTIYTATGDGREYRSTRGNRFILERQAAAIYAAEFLEGAEQWPGMMSRDALKEGFRMIRADR